MTVANKTIRVLVVDDSAIAQRVFSRALDADPGVHVIGRASDPYQARDLIVELEPDVVTLDVEMPRMDGITFLRKLMRYRPTPVVVVSSVTPAGGDRAMQALRAGAVEVLCKSSSSYRLEEMCVDLVRCVKAAALVRHFNLAAATPPPVKAPPPARLTTVTRDIIGIGSSTGGPEALRTVLARLPAGLPPVVIVQHMPPAYTKSLAESLHENSALEVREAVDGEPLLHGSARVAPGGFQLRVVRTGGQLVARVTDDPPVNRHRPSVDVMFESIAETVGHRSVGVIMTGMGDDGARGLLAMRQHGAQTIAQDEASCVVFGMPKVAIERGAALHVAPLGDIAAATTRAAQS